jgi:hypothetical protein
MSRKALSRTIYDKLLAAYVLHGDGAHAEAASAAGVDPRTARKTYEFGWPHLKTMRAWAVPLKTLIVKERLDARARMHAEAQEARAGAMRTASEDAANQLIEEAKLVRNVRNAANATLGVIAIAFPAAQAVAKQLVADVAAGSLNGKPMEAMLLLQRFATSAGRIAMIASEAQVMERRRLGKPTDVLGIQDVAPEDMDAQDVENAIAAAQRAFEVVKQHGLLDGVPPGETVELASEAPQES